MEKYIEINNLEKFQENYKAKKNLAVSRRSVSKNGLVNSAIDEDELHSLKNTFSIDVDAGTITKNNPVVAGCLLD